MRTDKDSYDAVIIGAGIGGLVCGCYLAKAGLKVMIVEQHYKPGGYCTSFTRKGFTFDAAAHSFGGYRRGGVLHKIFSDFDVDQELAIRRYEPSDIIKTPEHEISISQSISETIDNFQTAFPHEHQGIRQFFLDLSAPNPAFFAALRTLTFAELLDRYISDAKLRAILAMPLFGNGGLPPSLLSAFAGAKIYSEFLLDGGYYPFGGMQQIPDRLAKRFEHYGGTLLLKCPAKSFIVNDGTVEGIVSDSTGAVFSRHVVSNCDATFTFLNLLGESYLPITFKKMLERMMPSLSMFTVYIGLQPDHIHGQGVHPGTNTWVLHDRSLEDIYVHARGGDIIKEMNNFMVRLSPDSRTMLAFVAAPYRDHNYWDSVKHDFKEHFITRIESQIWPGLHDHMLLSEAATPATLHRYTGNNQGSAYGWAATVSQSFMSEMRKPQFVNNLYLVGHWTSYGQGIPGVAYIGYDTARQILRRKE